MTQTTGSIYKQHFYHGLLRKYIVAFGTMFKDLSVSRKDSHIEKVPIQYANQQKYVQRLISDPELKRQAAVKLPRMSFEMIGLQYAPERKITSKRRISTVDVTDPGTKRVYGYTPVPYDLSMVLTIYAKSQNEVLQLVEQIIPFFTPDYTISIKSITDNNVSYDVPINLVSVAPDAGVEGSFDDHRVASWSLDFVLKGYIFGPTRSGSIIKHINTELRDGVNDPIGANELPLVDIDIQPYIDGIALADIAPDDDFQLDIDISDTLPQGIDPDNDALIFSYHQDVIDDHDEHEIGDHSELE